jgi:multidrug resistance efflux pump
MLHAQSYRFLGLLAAALTVAACSRSADHAGSAQAAPVAQPQFAAMARGRVDVEGGLVRIAAPRDGVIAELRVAAGDAVKQGDLIAVIDAHQAELAAGVAKAELDQTQARAAALRAKTGGLKLRASRVSQAAEAGAATGQSADDANQALTELNADIAEADAAVEVARQHLKQARYEVEVRSVHAPVAGRIVSLPALIADVV